MKRIVFIACATTMLMASLAALANEKASPPSKEAEEPQDKPSVWMRMKLKHTEGIMAGLAAGDFEAISDSAKKMNAFSTLERWARGKDDEYQNQLRLFRHANRELIRQAQRENLDGATLAYMQLTVSCVNCHRAVRDAEPSTAIDKPDFTHKIAQDADYYLDGPQQGRPPEGTLPKGTKVWLIKKSGSYSFIESHNGVVAYVATNTLKPLED